MSAPSCFLCGREATDTTTVPSTGWGTTYPKALTFAVPACGEHAPAPASEQEAVDILLSFASKKATRPPADLMPGVWAEVDRICRAIFQAVYQRPWGMPLVLVSNRLGVAPEARDLYEELDAELKVPLRELYPEPGPHLRLDYHFFEVESDRDEDSVLWLRLPGGLVVYAWPGEL